MGSRGEHGGTGERFAGLDLLRGIAALAVVLFHLRVFGFGTQLLPHGYLAVDFFFILSGFVITHAYAVRLGGAISFGQFVRRRLVRLYPLMLLSMLVAAAGLLMFPALGPEATARTWAGIGFNALALPSVPTKALLPALFIVNVPLWSLFHELAINFAWGIVWPRLPLTAAVVGVGLCAALLVWLAVPFESMNFGAGWRTLGQGLVRAAAGIGLGALLYRLRHRAMAAPVATLGAALAMVLWLAIPAQTGWWELAVEFGAVLIVFPLTIVMAAGWRRPRAIERIGGDLSYPVYVLHWPVLRLLVGSDLLSGMMAPLAGAIALLAVGLVSWIALRAFDVPARRRLSAP